MPRTFAGALWTVGGALALVVGLAVLDDRVRDRSSLLFVRGAASSDISTIGARLQDVAYVVMQAVRDQSIEHAPLVIFALAAMVLVLFMLRT